MSLLSLSKKDLSRPPAEARLGSSTVQSAPVPFCLYCMGKRACLAMTRCSPLSLPMLASMQTGRETNGGILQGLFHCKIPPFVYLSLCTLASRGHLAMEEGLLHCIAMHSQLRPSLLPPGCPSSEACSSSWQKEAGDAHC